MADNEDDAGGRPSKRSSGRGRPWRGGRGGFNRFRGGSSGGGGGGFGAHSNVPKGIAIHADHVDTSWRHYMGVEDYQNAAYQLKVAIAKKYVENNVSLGNEEAENFEINYDSLISDEEILKQWPDIKRDMYTSAEKIMGIFGYASVSEKTNNVIKRARLKGFKESAQIGHLRAIDVGQLVHIRGTVVRVGHISEMCTWLTYECERCDNFCVVEQPHGKYTRPQKCPQEGCRSQTFVPKRNYPSTWTVPSQTIR